MKVGCVVFAWCAVAAAMPRAWANVPAQPTVGSSLPPSPGTAAPRPSGQMQVQMPPDRGRFAAFWVVPLATHRFQGAGLEAGYSYRWIAGLYRIGFVQNGYEPVSGAPLLALERTQRLFFDLEVDLRWRFANLVTLAAGGGAGFIDDNREVTSMSGTTWTAVSDARWHVRPLVAATLSGPLFQASVIGYVGSNSEARLSLGVCWGRR